MFTPRSFSALLPLFLLVPLALPTQAQPGDLTLRSGVEAHAGIDAIYTRFTQAYKDLDPARVADLYTEDALYLSPNRDVVQGRDAIEQNFASSFARTWEAGETLHIRFEILDRGIEGSLGYDVGYYHLDRTNKAGEVRRSTGKFTVVIRCEGKEGPCRFHVDGYSGVPAEEPADAEPPESTAPDQPAEPEDSAEPTDSAAPADA